MAETSKPKISTLERIGAPVTVVGALAIALPLLGLAKAALLGSFTLSTSDQVNFWVTTVAYMTIGAAVLSLIATGLQLPGLIRAPRIGRAIWTAVSGVALIISVLFLLLAVLPRANNLTHLNNVIEPFGTAIKTNCKTPLDNETTRYKQIEADGNAFPNPPNPSSALVDVANLGAAMTKDAGELQQDLTSLQGYLPKIQALTLPDGKYGALKDGCVRDTQSTIGFLNSSSSIPTSQVVQALLAALPALSPGTVPASAQPVLSATLQATIPSSYSAIGLAQAITQIASSKFQLVFPTGVPTATQASLAPVIYVLLASGYSQLMAGAMKQAAAATDPVTTNAGNCLADDAINILNDNLTPVKVDAAAIVGQAKMTCTK